MSENAEKGNEGHSSDFHPIPSTSTAFSENLEPLSAKDSQSSTKENNKVSDSMGTKSPGKILHGISPIPKIPEVKRTKRKHSGAVLTSKENSPRKKVEPRKSGTY